MNGSWVLDPHSPSERDPLGNENNILTIDDLQKLPVVGGSTSASAMEKENTSTVESSQPKEGSTEETNTKESASVIEAKEEAETQTSMTDQVKDKILGVAAPVTAAVGAASAAVAGFINGNDDDEKVEKDTSPIPGTFPDTPVIEKTESVTTEPVIDESKKTDDEPVPPASVPTTDTVDTSDNVDTEDKHNLETAELGTGEAAAAGGFAAALAADKEANTAPTHIPSGEQTLDAPPETNDSFGILPVPSETAPEGTKPLAESTYKAPAYVGSLAPEPVQEKEVSPVPESKEFEPVTNNSNVISSAGETTTSSEQQLKSAALASSEHAGQTATKALGTDKESVPTHEGVQEVTALGTEIVTDGGKESQALKTELLENGKAPTTTSTSVAPENTKTAVAEEKGPATPAKDFAPATPSKTPVSQSSAKKDKRVSGVPSEGGSEKKKRGGFLKKLKKIFS